MSWYDWDPAKAEATWRRHGVTFEEADDVIRNPLSRWATDAAHSQFDERMRVIGWSPLGRLIVVVVSTAGPRPRIISARRATKRERDAYTDR